MSGLCLFIGALAETHGLRVIAMVDETSASVFAQARRGLVLASNNVEGTTIFKYAKRGVGDVTGRCGCSPGERKDWSMCAQSVAT